MAKLADALDSKSCSFGSVGSTPTLGTNQTANADTIFFRLKLADYFLKAIDVYRSAKEYLSDPLPRSKLLLDLWENGYFSGLLYFWGIIQKSLTKIDLRNKSHEVDWCYITGSFINDCLA